MNRIIENVIMVLIFIDFEREVFLLLRLASNMISGEFPNFKIHRTESILLSKRGCKFTLKEKSLWSFSPIIHELH